MGERLIVFDFAITIIGIMFIINMLNTLNICYMLGTPYVSECPGPGVGHPFIVMPAKPLFGYDLTDATGNTASYGNFTQWNQTMRDAATYKQAPSGITDIFGFFSWIVTGIKFILNMLFLPIYGFPQWMTNFWIPEFITEGFGAILFIIQLLGIYEWATGRPILG